MNSLMKSEGGALAAAGYTGKVSLSKEEAEESSGVKAGKYLPYLKLMAPLTKEVTSGTFRPGELVLFRGGKDPNPTSLELPIGMIPITVRGKATKFLPDGTMEAEYDTIHQGERLITDKYEEFKTQAEEAKAAKDQKSPFKAGLDVLFWIPSLSCYSVYGAQSFSGIRAIQEEITQYTVDFGLEDPYSPVTISVIDGFGGGNTYKVISCSPREMSECEGWESIDQDLLVAALEQFNNPPRRKDAGAEEAKTPGRNR